MKSPEGKLKCGLLGRHLTHSFSPLIHSFAGDYSYKLFEIEPENADDFIRNGDYDCINVTIPYKENAYRVCDVLSEEAKEIKAVNTVCRKGGRLCGFNTDYFGFIALLKKYEIEVTDKKCIVLGSGGASKMAVYALGKLGAKSVTVISRSGAANYDNVYDICADTEVVINTTPVGMYPNVDETPIDISKFTKCEAVCDVIYNPATTRLLYEAKQLGVKTANGLYMLAGQGIKAGSLFTDKELPDSLIDDVCRAVASKTANIVLIGMPGCGKSFVGSIIAEKLGRQFIDIDAEIEKSEKRSIPDIFAKDGEEYFRSIETRVTARFCKQSGLVISTGGGVVTREENHFPVKCNSVVIYIKRDINVLPTDGRPVSQSTPIAEIYNARREKYETWCDFSVEIESDENGISKENAQRCADEICRRLNYNFK